MAAMVMMEKPDLCNAPSGVLDNPMWVQGNNGKV